MVDDKKTAQQRQKAFFARSKTRTTELHTENEAKEEDISIASDNSSIDSTIEFQNEHISQDPNFSAIETGDKSLGEILDSKKKEYNDEKRKNPTPNAEKNWSKTGIPKDEKLWVGNIEEQRSQSNSDKSPPL